MLKRHPRISIDPQICHGKPVIAGTRIMVAQIIGALAAGSTPAELLQDYPHLTEADITAALGFAKDAAEFELLVDVAAAG